MAGTGREFDAPVFQHHLVKVAWSQVMSGELQIAGHAILTKTETRKQKSETRKPKLEIRKSKLENRNWKIETGKSKLENRT
jgi:hypothetical protein